jgi:uncharacterized membrane protein
MTINTFLIPATTVLSGLIAGLFYGYDYSVIKGLSKLTDKEYLLAFQHINREIQNPYFFVSFMGAFILLPLATWTYGYENGHHSNWLLAATFFYWAGAFGITICVHVPLNNWLDSINLGNHSAESLSLIRQKFETKWNKWHHVRTYAAILSFGCSVLFALKSR